jgi:hypothetical protein
MSCSSKRVNNVKCEIRKSEKSGGPSWKGEDSNSKLKGMFELILSAETTRERRMGTSRWAYVQKSRRKKTPLDSLSHIPRRVSKFSVEDAWDTYTILNPNGLRFYSFQTPRQTFFFFFFFFFLIFWCRHVSCQSWLWIIHWTVWKLFDREAKSYIGSLKNWTLMKDVELMLKIIFLSYHYIIMLMWYY